MEPAETLKGLRVLVTRASHQSKPFTEQLSQLGATVIELPLIAIKPPDSWDEVDTALASLHKYDWIIFASANAVNFFFDRAEQKGYAIGSGSCSPIGSAKASAIVSAKRSANVSGTRSATGSASGSTRFATVGPGTSAALSARGIEPDYQAAEFVAEALVQQFPEYPQLDGIKILWPKTNIGRTYIQDHLTAAGATVQPLVCYHTGAPTDLSELAAKLEQLIDAREIDAITITSSEAATNLVHLMSRYLGASDGTHEALARIELVSIGPQTTKTLKEKIGTTLRIHQASDFTTQGMIAVLENISAAAKNHP